MIQRRTASVISGNLRTHSFQKLLSVHGLKGDSIFKKPPPFKVSYFRLRMYKQQLTKEQAFQKAKHYCAYQERCHSEVKEKLYSFGLRKTDVEQLLTHLIDEDYLNEERFAIQFAGGKFRMKQWGRVKIKYELKQKGVSEYCIKKALKVMDEEVYEATLQKLYTEKLKTLRSEKNHFIRKRKLQDYLLQKGYELSLIQRLFNHTD